MHYDNVIDLTSQALMLCVMLSLPAVAISAIVGLLVSFVQAITSLQDSSISQGLKLLVVTVVIIVAAPWAGSTMLRFTESLLASIFS